MPDFVGVEQEEARQLLSARVGKLAVALHLHEGKRAGTDDRPGTAAGGRTRQGGLLDLVDHAVEAGWSRRECVFCRIVLAGLVSALYRRRR